MKLFLLLAVLLCAGNAFADSSHRACAASNSAVCASLDFTSPVDTKDEGVFVVTVETPDQSAVQSFNVNLWMNMGSMSHKGAPVEITALDNNRFQVENAWFVMKGMWTILVDFTSENVPYHLEIPVNVTQ